MAHSLICLFGASGVLLYLLSSSKGPGKGKGGGGGGGGVWGGGGGGGWGWGGGVWWWGGGGGGGFCGFVVVGVWGGGRGVGGGCFCGLFLLFVVWVGCVVLWGVPFLHSFPFSTGPCSVRVLLLLHGYPGNKYEDKNSVTHRCSSL